MDRNRAANALLVLTCVFAAYMFTGSGRVIAACAAVIAALTGLVHEARGARAKC